MARRLIPRPKVEDHEALLRVIYDAGKEVHLVTIAELVDLAEKADIIPLEVIEHAQWLAKSEWVRAAARERDDENVPDLFNLRVTETKADGQEVVVQGWKAVAALDESEWHEVIETYCKGARRKQRLCNRIVDLANRYARQNGWIGWPLPFPNMARDDME